MYKKVDSRQSLPKMEEEILKFWEKNKIFEKSLEKDSPNGEYVFYDGPPFITGLPHYATLLPSIAKDVVPRYWTMRGYHVKRKWGWDCHGLPAENKVEKELGLRNKKDIEELGIDKFVDACRNYVSEGSSQWKWYIDRIGRWVDMDNAYKTMDLDFMESVIWGFKELYDKGLIYEGYRSSLHCPRCATPLSKFEITMDEGSYKEVTDESVTVKFELKENPGTYILAWTTTPWTLPGNLALAVGEDIDYVRIKRNSGLVEEYGPGGRYFYSEGIYIVAKDIFWNDVVSNSGLRGYSSLIGNVNKINEDVLGGIKVDDFLKKYEIEIMKGKDLVGKEYKPIFDIENKEIIEDKNTYKIYPADFVTTEDGTGVVHIAPNFGEDDFELGKKYDLPIVEMMDDSGCYTEKVGKEWKGLYFKKAGKKVMETLGDKLFGISSHTHSYPFCYRCNTRLIFKTQKAWYLKIDELREKMLKSNKDEIKWIPEYFKEGRFQYNLENAPDWCLSRSRYWGSPIPVWKCDCGEIKVVGSIEEIEKLSGQKVKDLHKPDIDEIELDCDCGKKMKRVPEVLDCWFESGAMPFAQFHYPFEMKDEFKKIFPADFIVEYTGQLRGWFYYLHVLSNALFDSVAFKNVVVTGVLAGTDGRKMSKSYGNYPDPKNTIEKYGSDALRFYFMSSPIMSGGDMSMNEKDLEQVIKGMLRMLWNSYSFFVMYANIDEFEADKKFDPKKLENLLDKWIVSELHTLIRDFNLHMENYELHKASRLLPKFVDQLSNWFIRRSRRRFWKSEDDGDKKDAYETLYYVLVELSKVMAPFMPFVSDEIFKNLTKKESVHLEDFPMHDEELIDSEVNEKMQLTRDIINNGLQLRTAAKIKVRQPLSELLTISNKLNEELIEIIKEEVNVKNVSVIDKIEVSESVIVDEESNVGLNTEITDKLRLEGMAREVVRSIQQMRKEAGFEVDNRIEVGFETQSKVFEEFGDLIFKETLADKNVKGKLEGADLEKEFEIEGEGFRVGIKKI